MWVLTQGEQLSCCQQWPHQDVTSAIAPALSILAELRQLRKGWPCPHIRHWGGSTQLRAHQGTQDERLRGVLQSSGRQRMERLEQCTSRSAAGDSPASGLQLQRPADSSGRAGGSGGGGSGGGNRRPPRLTEAATRATTTQNWGGRGGGAAVMALKAARLFGKAGKRPLQLQP